MRKRTTGYVRGSADIRKPNRRKSTRNADGTTTGAQLAFNLIYEAIVDGRLKPGVRLTETSVAAEIGLSRTPVREAMGRLEANGLLVHEPHRGMVIPKPDDQITTELYQVREVLEGAAAAMAAQQASMTEIELLREIVDSGRRMLPTGTPSDLARNNNAFHSALHRAAHNRYLLRTLAALQDSLILLGPTTLRIQSRRASSIDEHEAIITYIAKRDQAEAEAAARNHIRAAYKARLQLLFELQS
jgi:DNA-binding GntR family transcriptional regulator